MPEAALDAVVDSMAPELDDFLRQIGAGRLADIAVVVTLGEHVDHWERLG